MDILFSGSILVHNQEKEFAAIRESDPELYHAVGLYLTSASSGPSADQVALSSSPSSKSETRPRLRESEEVYLGLETLSTARMLLRSRRSNNPFSFLASHPTSPSYLLFLPNALIALFLPVSFFLLHPLCIPGHSLKHSMLPSP